jgi:NADH-quinone oxidoreductase subunit L
MKELISLFILIPLAGFLGSLVIPKKNEHALSMFSFASVGVQLCVAFLFTGYWLWMDHPVLEIKALEVFSTEDYDFFIQLFFDKVTVTYLLVGAFLTFLITIYSRYYMHREEGYKRFFNTLLFFYLGYNIIIFSGNFETLFIGWEILGISSFLLIAFYRDRYLPVKNAMKVFSVYRVGDIGLLLAMWLTHHLWHHNITFSELNDGRMVDFHLHEHAWVGLAASLLVILAATAKSAQFPFSSWLPRAMEGPTPSSAIFYSSLSVHIGVFILLRTFPFWEHQTVVQIVVIGIGFITAILATFASRVQSSVKAQVAYSSMAQIGIIFMEIALGFETLALIHFAGNAFLRSYQLLVSPSVVTYLIREQFYNFQPKVQQSRSPFAQKIYNTVYVLSLKEWNLDSILFYYLWNPIKKMGGWLRFIDRRVAIYFFVPVFIAGAMLLLYQNTIPPELRATLPVVFSGVGLLLSIKSFVERYRAGLTWVLIFQNHLWIALAITFNERFNYWDMALFLSGIIGSGVVGYFCLKWLARREPNKMDLNRFQGHSYEYKGVAFLFLLCCLSMAGFPITPTFIGEDLIFSHIAVSQVALLILVALSFVINGLALIRIYSRLFMGPHAKTDHPIAGRSS